MTPLMTTMSLMTMTMSPMSGRRWARASAWRVKGSGIGSESSCGEVGLQLLADAPAQQQPLHDVDRHQPPSPSGQRGPQPAPSATRALLLAVHHFSEGCHPHLAQQLALLQCYAGACGSAAPAGPPRAPAPCHLLPASAAQQHHQACACHHHHLALVCAPHDHDHACPACRCSPPCLGLTWIAGYHRHHDPCHPYHPCARLHTGIGHVPPHGPRHAPPSPCAAPCRGSALHSLLHRVGLLSYQGPHQIFCLMAASASSVLAGPSPSYEASPQMIPKKRHYHYHFYCRCRCCCCLKT
mmetsp:Transcript_17923/g.38458  ORF Transcript_17923/g.38458 Transcript_17923/m.38458 type:complete len:296 (+) Transcript_17923:627-1514(+)